MKKSFIFNAKVWQWPGDTGWHFVNVDKKISEKIRSVYVKGFVRIKAKTGHTSWETALFPHKLSGVYLISVKKNIRKKEGILKGDTIRISFEII